MARTKTGSAPHLFWTMTEGRAVFEMAAFYNLRRALKRLPKGDGHPVIVAPGFLGGDSSTIPLRRMLCDLGYDARGWGMGQNLSISAKRRTEFGTVVEQAYQTGKRTVSLVGWSLGGLFARQAAKEQPEHVRNVVSLGSPLSGQVEQLFAHRIYKLLNGPIPKADQELKRKLIEPPPVPSTSIYSRSDGVVGWRDCLQADGPLAENIRLPANHFGMGANPAVMKLLADRLAQEEGNWSPFEPRGLEQLVYS